MWVLQVRWVENKGEMSLRLYSVSLDGWLTQWQVVGGALQSQLTLALPPHHYIGSVVETLASPHNHNTTDTEDTLVPPHGRFILQYLIKFLLIFKYHRMGFTEMLVLGYTGQWGVMECQTS